MMDLNTLIPTGTGWELDQANGINDSGESAGTGQLDGEVHGFLLTPVAPQITSLSPASGKAGTLVTITGNHFTTKPKNCAVTVNGKLAKWTKWSNTQIEVTVPSGATSGHVVVTAFFQHSNAVTFMVK